MEIKDYIKQRIGSIEEDLFYCAEVEEHTRLTFELEILKNLRALSFNTYRVERRCRVKMTQAKVFFENDALWINYSGSRLKISKEFLRHVLELFWNHPSIKRLFLMKKNERGFVRSRIKLMDKAENSRPLFAFMKIKDGK